MFTGIIEELGTVERTSPRLRVRCRDVLPDLKPGASVAVNGACLTAVEVWAEGFAADLSPETLRLTNLGDLRPGSVVNLERPLAAGGRLDGHLVQGHVDGTGEVTGLERTAGENWWLQVRHPRELGRYIVVKGSIAIDGISLTVAALEGDVLAVAVIPHTYQKTNLRARRAGERVNLECDLLAKYVEKLLGRGEGTLSVERLRELGY
jgi:riboflavin synthase